MLKAMQRRLLLPLFFCLILGTTTTAFAHGVAIAFDIVGSTVDITARFDTGELMDEAQVLVYAPVNPREVWLSGVADADAKFSFDIDTAIEGRWEVRISKAAHGGEYNLYVENGQVTLEQSGISGWLRTVLTVVVLVGLAGVAYYFSRDNDTSQKEKIHARS